MTLFDLVKLHGVVRLDLPDLRGPLQVTAGDQTFDVRIEDVKFEAGGAITLVHQVKEEDAPRAWAGAPESCEACQ